MGYATEAGQALLAKAAESFSGEVLAIIDPVNSASQRVGRKLGFTFWKQAMDANGYLINIYRRSIPEGDYSLA